ncbi:GTPase IMAP family member 5-like [Lissotriton helveticus]
MAQREMSDPFVFHKGRHVSASDPEDHKNTSHCTKERETIFLLIGSTGAGKSATGNSILGERRFESRASARTVTLECQREVCVRDGKRLVVVDTPGFLNSTCPEELRSDVSRCLELCGPGGPHVLLLVLQTGRFTQEECEAVQRVQRLFGAQVLNRMVVVFTRKDDLGDKTIQAFVKEAETALRKLITKCGGRYCAFNNRTTGEENDKQVEELFALIDKPMPPDCDFALQFCAMIVDALLGLPTEFSVSKFMNLYKLHLTV